jgi:hypothetical protein
MLNEKLTPEVMTELCIKNAKSFDPQLDAEVIFSEIGK